jgi:8-oxo-dGTP pyrophosphatase MutT (NUDIX family)
MRKERKIKNKYLLEDFLNDPNSDVGTGLLITRGHGFCFTLKQPHRWGKTPEGIILLPFGGIGGKLEKNELPSHSLHREAKEEVGSDVEIISSNGETILISNEKIEKIYLSTKLEREPLPWIIYKSPKAEPGRKPFTNVLIYGGIFLSNQIFPLDDPAILEIGPELLIEIAEKPTSLKEFCQKGGRMISRIEIPSNGILKPIGTAKALYLCLKEKEKTILLQLLKKLNLKS